MFHAQYGRQSTDALTQGHAQWNKNGMEYCRQKKNNGVKGRAAPGREALCSENAIAKREPTRLKNNETYPTDRRDETMKCYMVLFLAGGE